jgi:hypothetical protein
LGRKLLMLAQASMRVPSTEKCSLESSRFTVSDALSASCES